MVITEIIEVLQTIENDGEHNSAVSTVYDIDTVLAAISSARIWMMLFGQKNGVN
mgnify:CR=1 FL=1